MKKVLVLGAGMVSKPLVQYLLDHHFKVDVGSRTVSKAEAIINGKSNGKAYSLNVKDDEILEKLVSEADLTVSLLPYTYHVKIAKLCLKNQNHLVTTSYVSDEMKQLHQKALDEDVLLLNESGLDPGIDHMSAMKIIHDVQKKNGKILSFKSTTGALPSHETNTNPFGYKFSWSPRGVLLASRNAAQWLENGSIVKIPGENLFEHYSLQDVPEVGTFENYPNRNSLPYKDLYGLHHAHTVYRGTFRFIGWCETIRNLAALGWLSTEPLHNFNGKTYQDLTKHLIQASSNKSLIDQTATYLKLPPYAAIIKRIEWLGLLSQTLLPSDKDTPLDYLHQIMLEKMLLEKDKRDMIVMHHEFIVNYKDHKESITSTLLDYGIPNAESAIARTVALPAAIAVRLILDSKITQRGVHIPVVPEIYSPILKELESLGIIFKEQANNL